jgi:hypothetical protein
MLAVAKTNPTNKGERDEQCGMNQPGRSKISDQDEENLLLGRLGNKVWTSYLKPAKWTKKRSEGASNELRFMAPSPEVRVGDATYFEGYISIARAYKKNKTLFEGLVRQKDTTTHARVEDSQGITNDMRLPPDNSMNDFKQSDEEVASSPSPQAESGEHPAIESQASKPLNRLAILPTKEEASCIPFDYPHLFPNDARPSCCGYFGFLKFPTEVAVWGHYAGLSFLPTLDAFLNPSPNQVNGTLFGKSYQVMAVHVHEHFVFMGFASGEVHCISMTGNCSDADSINIEEYPYISGKKIHPNEITCMSAFGERNIVSACLVKGKEKQVVIHWGALEDGNIERTYQFVVVTESIFSMASSTIFGTTLLQIGGRRKHIITTAWKGKANPQEHKEKYHQEVSFGNGHIIFLKYVGDDSSQQELVVGLSSGEVAIFEHHDPGDSVERLMNLGVPKQILPDIFKHGTLEAAELVGDVLILAGGPFGKIYFYNWKDHTVFGSSAVHPGVSCRGQDKLYSTVVALYFSNERGSLISLCRDGHVHEMTLAAELERAKNCKKQWTTTKKRARSQASAAVRPRLERRMMIDMAKEEERKNLSSNSGRSYNERENSQERKCPAMPSRITSKRLRLDSIAPQPSPTAAIQGHHQQQDFSSNTATRTAENEEMPKDQWDQFGVRDIATDSSTASSSLGGSLAYEFRNDHRDPCATTTPRKGQQQLQHNPPTTAPATAPAPATTTTTTTTTTPATATTQPRQGLAMEAVQNGIEATSRIDEEAIVDTVSSSKSPPSVQRTGILARLGALEEAYYGHSRDGPGLSRVEAFEQVVLGVVKRGGISERIRQIGLVLDRIGALEQAWYGEPKDGPKLERIVTLQQGVLGIIDRSVSLTEVIRRLEELI